MRFGSLFSGIGGLDLGLERAGMTCSWQVEIDPYCQKVLAKHWPDVPRYGDIREVDPNALEPVDLICGGFPCQDISYAGNGAGLSGARSGLWREMVRAIRLVRPRFALVENVAALLDRGLGTVLGDLAESRYDAEWDCLPAAAFGAPHVRDRLFVVAYTHGDGREGQPKQDVLSAPRVFPQRWNHADGLALAQQRVADAPAVARRVDDGLPTKSHRIRGLGNAVHPDAAEWLGRLIKGASA